MQASLNLLNPGETASQKPAKGVSAEKSSGFRDALDNENKPQSAAPDSASGPSSSDTNRTQQTSSGSGSPAEQKATSQGETPAQRESGQKPARAAIEEPAQIDVENTSLPVALTQTVNLLSDAENNTLAEAGRVLKPGLTDQNPLAARALSAIPALAGETKQTVVPAQVLVTATEQEAAQKTASPLSATPDTLLAQKNLAEKTSLFAGRAPVQDSSGAVGAEQRQAGEFAKLNLDQGVQSFKPAQGSNANTRALEPQAASQSVAQFAKGLEQMVVETASTERAGISEASGAAAVQQTPLANVSFSQPGFTGKSQMPVTVQFGQPQWAGQVAERAALMAAQKLSFAELQLDPPELGPLQVKVTVANDQATVTFVSANAGVREALDQTAMRLRDLLEQQGVDLLDVNVSDQSQQDHQPGEQAGTAGGSQASDPLLPDAAAETVTTLVVDSGVDYYV